MMFYVIRGYNFEGYAFLCEALRDYAKVVSDFDGKLPL